MPWGRGPPIPADMVPDSVDEGIVKSEMGQLHLSQIIIKPVFENVRPGSMFVDSHLHTQLQKLSRILNFRIQIQELYYLGSE